MEIPFQDIEN